MSNLRKVWNIYENRDYNEGRMAGYLVGAPVMNVRLVITLKITR